MLRLNSSTAVTACPGHNRLGVIGSPSDGAGFPNGRRPGDDVVDITLRVGRGRWSPWGLSGVRTALHREASTLPTAPLCSAPTSTPASPTSRTRCLGRPTVLTEYRQSPIRRHAHGQSAIPAALFAMDPRRGSAAADGDNVIARLTGPWRERRRPHDRHLPESP